MLQKRHLLFLLYVFSTVMTGCTTGSSPVNTTAYVDLHFLGGYTDKAGEGFYVIAGDLTHVREELKKILAGEPARSSFSRDENLNLVVFRGVFPTGGYGIEVNAVERAGNKFIVRATFTDPGRGAVVAQAFTQPTAVVPLGRLPPGRYTAELYVKEGDEEKLRTRIEFEVE